MRSHVLLVVLLLTFCASTSYAFLGSPFELCTGGNSQTTGAISSLPLGSSTFFNTGNRTLPSNSGVICPWAGVSSGPGMVRGFSVGSGLSDSGSILDGTLENGLCPFNHEIGGTMPGTWMPGDWMNNKPDTSIHHPWGGSENFPGLFVE
jgi:hypothetical protein